MISKDKDTASSIGKRVGPGAKSSSWLFGRVVEVCIVLGLILLLIYLIQPAVQKAREKSKKNESAKNLKEIGKAFQEYHNKYGHFPPAIAYGKDGEPLYSWRVLLLPFLGEQNLYSQFNLDEPWDSPTNGPLLAKMPLVYPHPTQGSPKFPYTTHYQVFTGGGALFELGPQSQNRNLKELEAVRRINDTILVVEARDPVEWTKPQDLPYDSEKPLPKLGGLYSNETYLFLMADGSVHGTYPGRPEEMVREIINCRPREWVD